MDPDSRILALRTLLYVIGHVLHCMYGIFNRIVPSGYPCWQVFDDGNRSFHRLLRPFAILLQLWTQYHDLCTPVFDFSGALELVVNLFIILVPDSVTQQKCFRRALKLSAMD